jgi:hypothetical protein
VLALASQQLAQELPELQQLHERLAVFALVAPQRLVQREPVLKQLVLREQLVPLVLQNFLQNQY